MYHILSRIKSGGGAAYLFSVAGRIACKDASLFDAFSGPWTSSLTFDKLRYIERRRFVDPHWFRGTSYLKIGWKWVSYALSGATVLIVKGAFVSFFSAAPPGSAMASAASAGR